jgi:hypothetical protein
MAKSFRVQELRFATETNFAENINSVTSNSYTTSLHTVGLPVMSFEQSRVDDSSINNYVNDTRPGYKGAPRGGTLEFTTYAGGHGTATTGALTENWLYTLLSRGLGGGSSGDTGTTVAGGTDADTFTTAANPADFAPGAIIRVGAAGDARGNGQPTVVSTIATTTVEALASLDGTPSAADVVYAMLMAYPASTGFTDSGGTTKTLKFICSHTDTGAQWHGVGCQLQSVTIGWTIGGLPTLTWRYMVAYWARGADTTPSAVSVTSCDPAPVAGVDLFFQTTGTKTRATIAAQSVSISLNLGLVPHITVGGDATYQTVTGYTRTSCTADINIRSHEWSDVYETLWDSDGSGSTYKHILMANTTTDGRVFAIYCPRTYIVGPRPTREDVDSLTGVSFTMRTREGATTTSDLTRSPIRFGIG